MFLNIFYSFFSITLNLKFGYIKCCVLKLHHSILEMKKKSQIDFKLFVSTHIWFNSHYIKFENI